MKKVLIGIVLFFVVSIGGCLALTTAGIMSIGGDLEEAKNEPGGSRETALALGDTATVDGVEYTLTDVATADKLVSTSEFSGDIEPDGGGHFVLVTYSAKNTSDSSKTIDAPTLEDDGERRFSQTSVMDDYVPTGNNCTFEVTNPGMSQVCTTVYQVPEDAAGLMVHFTSLGLSGGARFDPGIE